MRDAGCEMRDAGCGMVNGRVKEFVRSALARVAGPLAAAAFPVLSLLIVTAASITGLEAVCVVDLAKPRDC